MCVSDLAELFAATLAMHIQIQQLTSEVKREEVVNKEGAIGVSVRDQDKLSLKHSDTRIYMPLQSFGGWYKDRKTSQTLYTGKFKNETHTYLHKCI